MKSKAIIYIIAILYTSPFSSDTNHFSNEESMLGITQVWKKETKHEHFPKSRRCSLRTSQLSHLILISQFHKVGFTNVILRMKNAMWQQAILPYSKQGQTKCTVSRELLWCPRIQNTAQSVCTTRDSLMLFMSKKK